ncbi:MAG: DUF2264 domain-containing protein [Paracoccaceae bacterium]
MNPLAGNPLKTRADMAQAFYDLWQPMKPYYSAGNARVNLSPMGAHFNAAAAELEGFARPLWGLAPLVAGGFPFEDIDLYLNGLTNGSDPKHPEYWGDIGDFDQRTVETAAIGFALRIAPEIFWEPLSDEAKHNLGTWLNGAINHQVPACNWHFFKVLVGLGLEQVGFEYDRDQVAASIAEMETYYIEDGWYRDGPGRRMEHYIPFAMHFYGLIYAELAQNGDADQIKRYHARAKEFAPHYKHWFDDAGSGLPFGRSLTYRFAHAGFWGGYAFAGLGEGDTNLTTGEAKALALENLRWWRDNSEYDRDGIMPVGYAYPNTYMAESYNSAMSPYWAMKAFLPLMFAEDHPFWTTKEVPITFADGIETQPIPGHIIFHEKGQTIALAGGQEVRPNMRMSPEKYEKFAYSTRYGFSVETDTRAFDGCVFDNMLGVSHDGLNALVRTTCLDARVDGDMLYSKWQPSAGVEVETWLIAQPPGHIRVHRITNTTPIHVSEGGFAIAAKTDGSVEITDTDGQAQVENTNDISAIRALGADDLRTPRGHKCPPNSNLMAARSFVPQLIGKLEPGTHILAAYIIASPNKDAVAKVLAADITAPSIEELEKRRDAAKTVVVWDAPVQ